MSTGSHELSLHELSAVLDVMREGIQVIGRDFRYVYVNDAAALHGRRAPGDLVGRTMMECYPGIDETEVFAQLRRVLDQRVSTSMLNAFTYPDGSSRTFELRIEPCEVGVVVLSIDVTDSRKLESQLRHAQKMEAIGRLAGSVAHDFNNLLSVILSYSKMLLLDLNALDPIREDIEAIRAAGERAAELTTQLLAFGRRQVLAPRILDLSEAVRGAEHMLRRLLGEDIELVTICDRDAAKVKVDPGQLDQVIMNLAINARDAMPGGGKLTLETRNVALDDSYVAEHLDARAGPHVMLAVSDTGIGMDRETQARIFEPFFTTKEPGKGTGLGLATAYAIVEQHHGFWEVESELGQGSVFRIYLPVAAAQEVTTPSSQAAHLSSQGLTILVAEDEELVQKAVTMILERAGYRVLSAGNGLEALALLEQPGQGISLVLLDVVMPRMGGPETYRRIRERWPDMKVILSSGYTDQSRFSGSLPSEVRVLEKPYRADSLLERIRTELGFAELEKPPASL
jgi:PAS domain S-box-containing protein